MERIRIGGGPGRWTRGCLLFLLLFGCFVPSAARGGEFLAVVIPGDDVSRGDGLDFESDGRVRVLLGVGVPYTFRPHAGVESHQLQAGYRTILPPAGLFAARTVGTRLMAGVAAGFAIPGSGREGVRLPVLRTALHLAVAF